MDPKTRRQPVPARGEQIPAVIDAAAQTPPAAEPQENAPPAADSGTDTPPAHTEQADPIVGAVEARALVAFGDYEVDDIVEGDERTIEALFLGGSVDPHPDAVAFARSLQA